MKIEILRSIAVFENFSSSSFRKRIWTKNMWITCVSICALLFLSRYMNPFPVDGVAILTTFSQVKTGYGWRFRSEKSHKPSFVFLFRKTKPNLINPILIKKSSTTMEGNLFQLIPRCALHHFGSLSLPIYGWCSEEEIGFQVWATMKFTPRKSKWSWMRLEP